MNTLKKTIILSNKENKSANIAILTLEKKQNSIFGKIKHYGNSSGEYILGIKAGEKIFKQNIKIENKEYSFVLPSNIAIEETLGCVLCSFKNNEFTPLLWGNEKSENFKNKIVNNLRTNFAKLENTTITKNTTECIIKENSKLRNELENIEVEKTNYIPENPIQDSIINDYKNLDILGYPISPFKKCYPDQNTYFDDYKQLSIEEDLLKKELDTAYATDYKIFETDQDEINNIIDKELNTNTSHDFYNMIASQLQELFDKYPAEENLSKLIDNSKWCKIVRDSDNSNYVVGIISLDNVIKYICYGVPGSYNNEPPREMQGYSQWLPTDTTDPYNNGYWVMYQDADTGENIYLN